MMRLLKESFVPVLLVITSIFMLVYYSNYVASLDAEQVTVITIPAHIAQQEGELDDVLSNEVSDDEEMQQVAVLRVDEAEAEQAYALLQKRQWLMAEQSYLELFKSFDSSQSRADFAYVYYKQKAYEPALQQLTLALAQKPVYLAAYYYRAKVYSRMKDYVGAEKDYLFFIKQLPQHFYAHFRLGSIKYKQQSFHEAIKYFDLASKLAPGKNKSRALLYLAKSYQQLGKEFYPKARDAYQASIRVAPGEINPRLGMASLLPDTEQGRVDAEEIYMQVLNLRPNESRAYSRLAAIYNKQGRDKDAQTAYEKSVEFNPSSASARYNLGLLLLKKKKWQEAIDQFQAVLNIDTNNAKAHFNLGRSYYKLKNYEQALKHYQNALSLRSGDYPEVAVNLGLIYSAQNQYDKAIEIYKAALEKNVESASLHYNLGLTYFKSGQAEKSMASYLLAIKYRPKYAQAWYNIARIHSLNENYEAAVAAYRKALEINPGYRSAQLNLAVALTRLGEPEQAELIYRQVLTNSPRYFSAWLNLGLVLMDQERNEEAEDVFYQASQLDAEDDKVISLLARSLRNQNKLSDSEKYYRIALDMKPDSKRYRLEYIRVLIQQKKYERASIEVEKGIKLFPSSERMKKELENLNTRP
ncbi:MAG: tetratricopeptide repeat protein [Gammaproteobacteria bacterium]|nr:tetratricopeptide repeat protein [Gammaproteobacteria bacterium]